MLNVKTLLFTAAVACVVITARATQQTGIESSNGLRMSLAHDEAVSGPARATHFIVTFSNLKRKDVILNLGVLDCGSPFSKTSGITLNLTDSRGNRHRRLPYMGDGPPYRGLVACGAMTPFVAVLHPGGSYALPLDIGKYLDLSDSKQYQEARFPAGKYSLQAELRSLSPESGVPRSKDWIGTVGSNIVEVHFESEFAALLDDSPE